MLINSEMLELAATLLRTFFIIGIGAASNLSGYLDVQPRRASVSSPPRSCLPALLFRATATSDLASLRPECVAAVILAKWAAFAAAAVLGMYYDGRSVRTPSARAAARRRASRMHGLFVTNTNDIAIGVPVLSTVFPAKVVTLVTSLGLRMRSLFSRSSLGSMEYSRVAAETTSGAKSCRAFGGSSAR